MPTIQFKKLHPATVVPEYATDGDAAVDLRAAIDEPLTLNPGDVALIPSGFAMFIGDRNFAGLILPRSGLGHKQGIILSNGSGLIDAFYQGQVMVGCWNRSREPYVIKPQERIAQMVITPVARAHFKVVQEFTGSSERGAGGFGSTGHS